MIELQRGEASVEQAGDLGAPPMSGGGVRARRMWRSFRRLPSVMVSAAIVLLLAGCALLAPWIAPFDPFDPAQLDLSDGFTPPLAVNELTGRVFILGADDQGRDVLSAILYGLRISLFVGVAAVLFAMVIGVALGLLAGWQGRWVDAVIMRAADVQLSFPSILIALLIFGVARGSVAPADRETAAVWILVVAIGLSDWVQYARTVRAVVSAEKRKEYVLAARAIGCSPQRIIFVHIFPSTMSSILVMATMGLALAIISEATLSFLGVGVPATQPSLGTQIRVGQSFLYSGEWWILLFPALTLTILALSVNVLGDWLRDAVNPRLR